MLLLSVSTSLFYWGIVKNTTVRGVNVGVGHGSSVGAAKRIASIQALEYLKTHGKSIPNTPNERLV